MEPINLTSLTDDGVNLIVEFPTLSTVDVTISGPEIEGVTLSREQEIQLRDALTAHIGDGVSFDTLCYLWGRAFDEEPESEEDGDAIRAFAQSYGTAAAEELRALLPKMISAEHHVRTVLSRRLPTVRQDVDDRSTAQWETSDEWTDVRDRNPLLAAKCLRCNATATFESLDDVQTAGWVLIFSAGRRKAFCPTHADDQTVREWSDAGVFVPVHIDMPDDKPLPSRISSLGGSDDMQTAKRPTNGIGCPECEGSRRSAGERSFRATIVCEHGREVVTGGTLITLEEDLPGPPKP